MLRSAVERQLQIVGEALAQLARQFPQTAAQLTRYEEVISFRNFLVHGYSFVNEEVVWSVVCKDLALLRGEVVALLEKVEGSSAKG